MSIVRTVTLFPPRTWYKIVESDWPTIWPQFKMYFKTWNTGISTRFEYGADGLRVVCWNWEGYWLDVLPPNLPTNYQNIEIYFEFTVRNILADDPLLWFCVKSPSKSFGNSGWCFPYGGWFKLWIITRNYGEYNFYVATGSFTDIVVRKRYQAKLQLINKRATLIIDGQTIFSNVDVSDHWNDNAPYLAFEFRRLDAVLHRVFIIRW
jgi:hypothetical protein